VRYYISDGSGVGGDCDGRRRTRRWNGVGQRRRSTRGK